MEAWFPAVLAAALLAVAALAVSAAWVAVTAMRSTAKPRDRSAEAAIAWQARAREALDAVPDWVVLLDGDKVVDSNAPSRCPFPGAGAKAVGRPLDVVYPDTGGVLLDHLERVRRHGKPLVFEFLHQQGSRYAEARLYHLGDALTLVITRDTTERKAKEEVLHRSKERFALAAQGANDGLWDWDLDTDEVYFSYQWKTIVGHDPTVEANRPDAWFQRVHPDDLAGVHAALQGHLSGEVARFESEHRIWRGDGVWGWVLARGMAVRNADGAARRIAGSITDLTNRRAVAVTQEKANLLEHATASVGIGIAVLDANQQLRRTGDQLRAMTAEWRDLADWWRDVSADHPPPAPVPCPTCGGPHHVGTVLAEVYRPQSGAFPVGQTDLLSRVFEIAWAGHAHEIGAAEAHVLLVKDVTDRVRAERRLLRAHEELTVARDQALAASRAKSAFLANMSHELRTPLNHMIGYAEMVSEELQDTGRDDLASDLGRVRESGTHLLDLITGILDLSRIEAGLSDLQVTRFPVKPLLVELTSQWSGDAARRGVAIDLLADDDPGEMVANRDQVRRTLDALLSNAVKFTERGRIELSVETIYRAGREWLVFVVRDTGMGMPPDVVRRLFDGFSMGDESSTRTHGGAGLGLTLAHRFTDMHGGAIDVSSHVGEGSTFRVTLPRDGRVSDAPDDEITAEIRLPE